MKKNIGCFMKVALIDIPITSEVDNGYAKLHKEIIFPSLGLYYLKEFAASKIKEIDVSVYNLVKYRFEEAVNLIINENPDVIGLTCYTDRRALTFDFIKAVKSVNPNIVSVLGGPHATVMPVQILENYPFIDFIVLGEGEITFAELLQKINDDKKDFDNIKGLAFKKNQIIITGKRPAVLNLDDFPYPKFSKFPSDLIKFNHYDGRYFFKNRKISDLKTMSIITSRGCPFKCSYCSTSAFWGNKVRYRTADNVVEEIEYLNKIHNVEFINIIDDAFTIDKQRVFDICSGLIEKKIDVCWICETNVKTIDDEMLCQMKKAGCFAINYGVESGSPVILKNIKKNITENEIVNAVRSAEKNGIIPDIFLMVGNPGENNKTISETLEVLKKARPSSGGWGILTIFPGTEIYANCIQNKYIEDKYWLSDKCSPFYLKELPYLKMQIYLNKLRCFFLFKNKNYRLWIRYKLLEFRDLIFLNTGIKLSLKKGIQFQKNNKARFLEKKL